MYDGIYADMVKSCTAIEIPNEGMVMLDGKTTDSETEI
jgi:hypothetical protein